MGQPLWLDEDQDKVHAWLRARSEVCPQCGSTEADWIDPATRRFLDPPKWEPVTFRCHGCAEVERTQSAIPRGEAGVRVILVPFDADREDED